MNLNKKEIEFIKDCIEHYWEDWNRDHPDNEKNKKISDKLVKKLNIPVVVGQSEQLVCDICEKPLEKVLGKICENTMCDRYR